MISTRAKTAGPLVERCHRLDIRALQRAGALAPDVTAWGVLPDHACEMLGTDKVRLWSVARRDSHPWGLHFLPVTWTACNFGGRRPWWRCPSCFERVAVLLARRLPGPLACRTCVGAVYLSTRQQQADRLRRRACKAMARVGLPDPAGSVYEGGGLRILWKRPRVRWATYSRHATAAEDLWDLAEVLDLRGCIRFLNRLSMMSHGAPVCGGGVTDAEIRAELRATLARLRG